MIRRHSEQLMQEIKLELDNYDTLSDKDKEKIISLIDQKISDLSILIFRDLNKDYEELQRISKAIKSVVRNALVKEYKDPTQIALQIIGGLAAIGGGFAAGAGLVYGGNAGNMALKLGKLAMSGSQGISLIDKIPENFSQARKLVEQDEMDIVKNDISNNEEFKRDMRQAYNKEFQHSRDHSSQEHSTKREVVSRGG